MTLRYTRRRHALRRRVLTSHQELAWIAPRPIRPLRHGTPSEASGDTIQHTAASRDVTNGKEETTDLSSWQYCDFRTDKIVQNIDNLVHSAYLIAGQIPSIGYNGCLKVQGPVHTRTYSPGPRVQELQSSRHVQSL